MEKSGSNKKYNGSSKLAQEKNIPLLLSAHELAAYLHKSVRWVHMERSAGRLPTSLKLGRSRFWIAEDIAAWMRSKIGGGDANAKN